MRTIKRYLAWMMTVVMLISALPMTALANNEADQDDTVVYNLLDCPIRIGSDEEKLDNGELDDLFDENGNYTIRLEENALFPYEVQFTYRGETWEEWFMSANDSVVVGGHTFKVSSEYFDPSALTKIGVWVGDEYVQAWPEEKNFTTEPQSSVFSMLPLREVRLTLDLRKYFPSELENISISAIRSWLGIDEEVSCWAKWDYYDEETGNYVGQYDDYVYVVSEDTAIDLFEEDKSSCKLELIVGTYDQLDMSNVRYSISVRYDGDIENLIAASIYTTDDPRQEIFDGEPWLYRLDTLEGIKNVSIFSLDILEDRIYGEEAYLSLRFANDYHSGLTATVYEGYYESEAGIPEDAVDITSQIWNQSNMSVEGGYLNDYSHRPGYQGMPEITIVVKRDEKIVYVFPIILRTTSGFEGTFGLSDMYMDSEDEEYRQSVSVARGFGDFDYDILVYVLDKGYSAEQTYYLNLSVEFLNGLDAVHFIKKAVVGTYTTESEIPDDLEDIKEQLFSDAGQSGGGYGADYSQGITFTIVDNAGGIYHFGAKTVGYADKLKLDTSGILERIWADKADGAGRVRVCYYAHHFTDYVSDIHNTTCFLEPTYPVDGIYYVNLKLGNYYATTLDASEYVEKAVVGYYETADEIPADAEDIKDALFSDASEDGGYAADYSKGVVFTVLDANGDLHHVSITIKKDESGDSTTDDDDNWLSPDLYLYDVRSSDNGDIDCYVIPENADSYYDNGYQTLFLLKNGHDPVTDEQIIPIFAEFSSAKVYASYEGANSVEQISGETSIPFVSGKAIQYSVSAKSSGEVLKNYWVTFVTQQSGAKLFVNAATNSAHRDEDGTPVREVFLNDQNGNAHDVFFANIGDEELTGLYVKLEDAQNVALDDYWTIGGVNTLSAFRTVEAGRDADGNYVTGELPNVGKIRLVPTGDGPVSGTLIIGSENGGVEKIKLTGLAGSPKIVTTEIAEGVLSVPYSCVLQTNNMHTPDSMKFQIVGGTLPAGVVLKPNGEIYGTPEVKGEFPIKVEMVCTMFGHTYYAYAEYTLKITENTSDSVWESTDSGYEITTPVGTPEGDSGHNYIITSYEDRIFVSKGEFDYFEDFWIDDVKQVRGVDYKAEEGSTKITIFANTFKNFGTGTHTIAAEFREEDGSLKRAAQNYTVELKPSNPTPPVEPDEPDYPDYDYDDDDDYVPVKPEKPDESEDEIHETPEKMTFSDIKEESWYYDDVEWTYENSYMLGMTGNQFAPNEPVSQATIVTVLARMAKVDLTRFSENVYDSIPNGTWYTNAAVWAVQSGLLPSSTFGGEDAISRSDMAIMLVKYLKHVAVDVERPETPIVFADADLMPPEVNDAFQILYHLGVFKGVGDNRMDPGSSTSRAQFAALLHRLSDLAGLN